jgi:hypothetical protein
MIAVAISRITDRRAKTANTTHAVGTANHTCLRPCICRYMGAKIERRNTPALGRRMLVLSRHTISLDARAAWCVSMYTVPFGLVPCSAWADREIWFQIKGVAISRTKVWAC